MASGDLLVGTAVMGLLLVGAGVAVARLRRREHYTPKLRSYRRDLAALPGETADARSIPTDTLALVAAVLVVVVAGAAIAMGAGAMVLAAVAPLVLLAYFAWGIYSMARARGLPRAHSIGLSAWLFGVVLAAVIGVKLLL
ncbi:hypothetical protein [Halobacterium bonnevillei]|uniref:Uncharacterized protein n=1 Tax=Halobacterium bonnevillei TaxID=2692200 RepID=A0A6B0SFC6_9EURY|nr:hypothetical protein [Halobacterium bonnevillei]MXR20474.1 hypothetical protein [Halobacterium bonnevillei]